jgi:hypothetical protein
VPGWPPQRLNNRAENPNDPRVKLLRRFRGFALFWICILVAYFVGLEYFIEKSKTSVVSTFPVFLLLTGCILIAAVWHAAAIVAMTVTGLFERNGHGKPWGDR